MTDSKRRYLSVTQLSYLTENINNNIDRYMQDGFNDLANESGWQIPAEISVDLSHLDGLISKAGADNEVQNSRAVWRALHNLPPALATENRVWTRLSHLEGFSDSQARWLKLGQSTDAVAKQVQDHFFAPSPTRYREDHAIGRLWWNANVAKILSPEDQVTALELILSKADIRSNLVERSWSFSRIEIGRALLRSMTRIPETHATEKAFREFMKQVNKYGGGLVFEALDQDDCDQFMDSCWEKAEPLVG